METFVYKDHKKLRCGYTTGTCAALAAQGAVRFLLTGSWRETEELMTPKGIPVRVALEEKTSGDGWAECAVRKDAGDDYDVTNGILVYARAEFPDAETGAADHAVGSFLPQIVIDGGIGIGRVTKPGLDQPVGAAAINSVPRKMIRDARGCTSRRGRGTPVCSRYDQDPGWCGSCEKDLQSGPRDRGRDLGARNQRDRGADERGSTRGDDPDASECFKGGRAPLGHCCTGKYGSGISANIFKKLSGKIQIQG